MTAEDPDDSESDNSGSPNEERCIDLDQTIKQSADNIFKLFRSGRRREAIKRVAEMAEDEQIQQGDLATDIAAVENDKPTEAVTASERKNVLVALYQYHLERLEQVDIVTWTDGVVSKDENAEPIADVIKAVETMCTES